MASESAGWAGLLSARGPLSAAEVAALQTAGLPEDQLASLLRALHESVGTWADPEVAQIIAEVRATVERDDDLSSLDWLLRRWAAAHATAEDRAACVTDCLSTLAPEEVAIRSVLSRRGQQKLVFLGDWLIPPESEGSIVVKRFLTEEAATKLLSNERRANRLSLEHPNIIDTNVLRNVRQEPFLVERRVTALGEDWQFEDDEAANLLHDGASALSFLATYELTHGDIKPDNLAVHDQRYLLLDFGICDQESHFQNRLAEGEDPSGTMRTRPPEVLRRVLPQSCRTDVWALAATVFRLIVGRYPLLLPEDEDEIPATQDRDARRAFELSLADRADTEWHELVTKPLLKAGIGENLRAVLSSALGQRQEQSVDAAELHRLCQKRLAGHVRAADGARLAPRDEIRQLNAFLPEGAVLDLMPSSRKRRLRETLSRLRNATLGQEDMTPLLDALDARLARAEEEDG